ncbi:threonine--tRNA ligase [Marinomonas fungiae]|nr:threonine--tRNA ligase [Marinomonas fungiae]
MLFCALRSELHRRKTMQTHREIAQQLDLFHSDPIAPGMIFWHPNGWQLFQDIQAHIRSIYRQDRFQEVRTPQFLKKDLWEISGHMAMYREAMFFGGEAEGEEASYALKPMSCPAHILLYKRGIHSYRELPLKWFEFGLVHRNESSGSLNGCLRLRQFTQDDAHVFCAWSQAKEEIKAFLRRAKQVYQAYGYRQLQIKVSTRPESALGSEQDWARAEAILIEACQQSSEEYEIQVGEGAFYGPKIELALEDSIGRIWQCGTVQLDFNLPERFGLEFTNSQGQPERPIILHQAVYGSLERWIGILLEVTQGKLPEWIHPMPVAIIPVESSADEYARQVVARLLREDINTHMESGDGSIGRKIKRCYAAKIPNIVIVGDREVGENSVMLRRGKEQEHMSLEAFIALLKHQRGH